MNYLLMFVIISIVILLHELGHFLAAKRAGIPIARFSVGFGPKVWGFNTRETEYWISAFPCGGYVLPALPDEEAFSRLPIRRRLLFFLAGPSANIVGALICASILNMVRTGISFETAFVLPIQQTWKTVIGIFSVIPLLLTQPDQLSGVVGIVALGGKYAGTNIIRLLEVSFLLNVNLAVINLLPILPLDGGKIAMALLQKLYSPIKRLQMPITVAGWALLMCLMAYLTIVDVAKIAYSTCA